MRSPCRESSGLNDEQMAQMLPKGRIGVPDDVARVVLCKRPHRLHDGRHAPSRCWSQHKARSLQGGLFIDLG